MNHLINLPNNNLISKLKKYKNAKENLATFVVKRIVILFYFT